MFWKRIPGRCRAAASLEEAEGHQHLADGHRVGANKCFPFHRGGVLGDGAASPRVWQ